MDYERGVLVGCDQNQEWLLSWWWENYRRRNSLPVAFADLGMTEEARGWCQERGVCAPIAIDACRVAQKEEVDPLLAKEWETTLSPFWGCREAWFKKPSAMFHSPFFQTLWLDLDCEIVGDIEPAFQYIDPISKMGLVRVRELQNGSTLYNGGVVAFEKNSSLLKRWVEASLSQNHLHLGDQDLLSEIIFQEGYEVGEIPEIYNWIMCRGIHIGAVVLHWAAEWGKAYIRKHGGLSNQLSNFTLR